MRQSVVLAVLATLLVSACADMLVGGKSESSQVDDAVRKAADVAVHKLNSDSNLLTASLGASAATPLRVAAIKDVKTQVVAGINYFLTLQLTDAKGDNVDVSVTVWSRPWLEARNAEDAWRLTEIKRLDA